MSFDAQYEKNPALFGTEPDEIVVRFAHLIPRGSRVLDLGVGQGRNALPLARRGLAVDAIDPSAVSVGWVREAAAAEGLQVCVAQAGFETFDAAGRRYGAILALGLIQLLGWPEISGLVERVAAWSAPGGLLFLTGFTTDDDGWARRRARGRAIGPNCFEEDKGERRTYLEPGQALALFSDHEVVHHWEGLGPWHQHGDAPAERHARVEAVLRAGL